jgi:phosphoenolpyruvate-protein kinase (PTS system EI component)
MATMSLASKTLYEVGAQNATNATGTNQTTEATASQFGNLTAAGLDGVLSDLREARDSILDNDTGQAYNFLGFADNGLFGVAEDVGPQNMASFQQQLTPVRDAIQKVRDALVQNEIAKALEELNTVDVAILKVVQALPTEEEEEPE